MIQNLTPCIPDYDQEEFSRLPAPVRDQIKTRLAIVERILRFP